MISVSRLITSNQTIVNITHIVALAECSTGTTSIRVTIKYLQNLTTISTLSSLFSTHINQLESIEIQYYTIESATIALYLDITLIF